MIIALYVSFLCFDLAFALNEERKWVFFILMLLQGICFVIANEMSENLFNRIKKLEQINKEKGGAE